MNIRDMSSGDLDAAWALNQANRPALGDVSRQQIERIMDMSAMALAAAEHGRLIGFCLVLRQGADYTSVNYRWFAEHYDDFVYLDRVAVLEDARGRGVGAALYAEVARRAGAGTPFTLEVNLQPRNDASLAFHRRLGFVEVGRQTADDGFVVSLQARTAGAGAGPVGSAVGGGPVGGPVSGGREGSGTGL